MKKYLLDVRTQEPFDIWELIGKCSQGYRIREAGLVEASVAIENAIGDRVNLLIFNRFGRTECLGRGLLQYYSLAIETGIPVLTCVREPHLNAWNQFHGGLAINLRANFDKAIGWAKHILNENGNVSRKERPLNTDPSLT